MKKEIFDALLGHDQARNSAADSKDDDPFHAAEDPAYVMGLLKQAEGQCVIDSTTTHAELALAAIYGTARRTLEKQVNRVESLSQALEKLIKEYTAERDALYDGATNQDGAYDHPDDRQAVEEMDAIIDAAKSALTGSVQ